MNARDFALITLDRKQLPGWKTNLRERRQSWPEDLRDRALAEQIVNGVVKNALLLQGYIEHFSSRRLASIDPLIAKILAIAMYQMKFLDRVPQSAAVDEAVNQTRRFRRASAAGFVNAVLRNVGRQGWPAEPDERLDPAGYARRVLSHPPELFGKLAELLGSERAVALCRHDNTEPPTVVRLGKGIEAEELSAAGVEVVPHVAAGLFVVRGGKQEIFREWAERGIAQVQDATAADVVSHLAISPGMRVLDRCAGLGTKTLQIWEAVGADDVDRGIPADSQNAEDPHPGPPPEYQGRGERRKCDGPGEIVAMDASAFRCAQLRELLKVRRIENVNVIEGAKMKKGEAFDRILIDVPCSNSGVLARRPEARYRGGVDCLVKVQREILEDTAGSLAPGGILVYSTCSVWPEENERQVADFLARNPGFELVGEKMTWPSFETPEETEYRDGGYWAVLKSRR